MSRHCPAAQAAVAEQARRDRMAELRAAIDAAPGWGASVAAMHEELEALKAADRAPNRDALRLSPRPFTLACEAAADEVMAMLGDDDPERRADIVGVVARAMGERAGAVARFAHGLWDLLAQVNPHTLPGSVDAMWIAQFDHPRQIALADFAAEWAEFADRRAHAERTRDVSGFAFVEGDPIRKVGGDYELPGEVRCAFTKKSGAVRYVVEHEPGFLHIYNGTQLLAVFAVDHVAGHQEVAA